MPVSGGNGLAVTAMVLGIIGAVFGLLVFLFFLAIPLGILALIFGVIGLQAAPKRGGAGKRQAVAGLVLGGVAVVLGIVGALVLNSFFDDLERGLNRVEFRVGQPADPADYDLTLDTCGIEAGTVVIRGSIVSNSDRLQRLEVTIRYTVGPEAWHHLPPHQLPCEGPG